MKQEFFESSEYVYYVETAKELIKRIQKYLNKPEDKKIYVINKQNHLLISYDDKTEPADDSEWGKEYARTLQHFEILKAKLNVSREHAIDTFDRLTESDTRILGELPATDFCEQKSMGASGGLFHAQPEGIAETKRIPAAGLLKGLLAVLQFTLLSPGYAVKIPNCPQSSGRSRYPSEDNGHSLSYL